MSIKLPILDGREIKKMCIYAYVHFLLKEAEDQVKEGKGEQCIEQSGNARDIALEIFDTIEQMNYTYDRLEKLAPTIRTVAPTYNTITKVVRKNFKAGDPYIPHFLSLCLLQEMKLRGHKEFEHIDLLEVMGWYEIDKRSDTNYHHKCAIEILQKIYRKK